jgi:hypothetical protein
LEDSKTKTLIGTRVSIVIDRSEMVDTPIVPDGRIVKKFTDSDQHESLLIKLDKPHLFKPYKEYIKYKVNYIVVSAKYPGMSIEENWILEGPPSHRRGPSSYIIGNLKNEEVINETNFEKKIVVDYIGLGYVGLASSEIVGRPDYFLDYKLVIYFQNKWEPIERPDYFPGWAFYFQYKLEPKLPPAKIIKVIESANKKNPIFVVRLYNPVRLSKFKLKSYEGLNKRIRIQEILITGHKTDYWYIYLPKTYNNRWKVPIDMFLRKRTPIDKKQKLSKGDVIYLGSGVAGIIY